MYVYAVSLMCVRLCDLCAQNTVRVEAVKASLETGEEARKTETLTEIENKLSMASVNREKELQKKIENVKKQVWSPSIHQLFH